MIRYTLSIRWPQDPSAPSWAPQHVCDNRRGLTLTEAENQADTARAKGGDPLILPETLIR